MRAFICQLSAINLISQGCKVKGTIEHSILSANVTVEKNAKVRDCIILPNATIEEGVELEKTIVDEGVKVTRKKLEKLKELKRKYKNDIFVVGKYKIQAQSEIGDK